MFCKQFSNIKKLLKKFTRTEAGSVPLHTDVLVGCNCDASMLKCVCLMSSHTFARLKVGHAL